MEEFIHSAIVEWYGSLEASAGFQGRVWLHEGKRLQVSAVSSLC